MEGFTPAEQDIRREAAGADPDAGRYADAHRIMHLAQEVPGIPFPSICRDRATFFFTALPDDEAAEAIRTAGTILGYALGVTFEPRRTEAHGVRHDILTAELGSGLKVDLAARAQYAGGQDAREDAPQLVTVAA